MRKRTFLSAIGVAGVALAAAGCGSDGLSPRETSSQNYSTLVYSACMADSPGGPATRPVVRTPMKVAVVQAGEVSPPHELIEALRSHDQLFSRVEPLPGMFSPDAEYPSWRLQAVQAAARKEEDRETLEHIRQAAVQMGMDEVLILGGTVDHSNSSTPLDVLDLTIVGAFVVPSHIVQADGRASAVLLDAATGRVVLTVSTDARRSGVAPSDSVAGAEERTVDDVRDDLVRKITVELIQQMSAQTQSAG